MSQTSEKNGSAEQEEDQKPAFRKTVGLAILGIVVVALLIGGALYYVHAMKYESTDDAAIDGNIVPVSAKVSGRVLEVPVDDNQEIATGTVVAKLDPRDSEARLGQARAAYDVAVAKLEVARTAVELTRANTDAQLSDALAGVEAAKATVQARESDLAATRADVSAAEAENTRRQADLKRYEQVDQRLVTQQQVDAARSAAETARVALNTVQKHVTAAESAVAEAKAKVVQKEATVAAARTAPQQIASAQSQVSSAQAAVAQAKAALDAAQLDLSYTTITAPVGGRVARKSVQPGQYMQVGQAMMAVVQPDVWVAANFKETEITRMRAGQEVDISVDAYPGKEFRGKVASIQAGTGARFSLLPPENATGNYVKVVQRIPVRIEFDGDEHAQYLLAPGMSVVPHVHVGADQNQRPAPIAIPAQATIKP